MNHQMENAAGMIHGVVDQQLAFLKKMMSNRPNRPVEPESVSSESVFPQPVLSRPATDSQTAKPDSGKKKPIESLGEWHLLQVSGNDETSLEQANDVAINAIKKDDVTIQRHPAEDSGLNRRILIFKDKDDAISALTALDPKRVITARADKKRSLIMIFPGVGDHYLQMGRGLYDHAPLFRAEMDRCFDFLEPEIGINLRDVLYPAPPSNNLSDTTAKPATVKKTTTAKPRMDFKAMLGRSTAPENPDETRLNRTIHSQPIVFIIEYALGKMWLGRNLNPAAFVGYSIGEYTAACLSGVMTLEDSLTLVARRAKMIEQLPKGVLLAVPMTEAQVMPLLGENLSISIVSTVNQCVIGGPEYAITLLEKQLLKQDIVSRRLPGTHAFHSDMMIPLRDSIIDLVQGFKLNAPEIPYLSNVSGTWINANQATDPAYWANHTCQTVRFADCVEKLLHEEGRVFLETGPGQSLGSFILQHPRAHGLRDKIVLPSLRNRYERQTDEAFFLNTAGKLWLSGI